MGYAYPIDSKVVANPNGTIDYDRASSSTQLRGLIKSMITNGVNLTESTNLQVMAQEGTMNVIVKPGFVILEGALKHFEDDVKVKIANADASHPRIDTVVARLNLNEDVRDIVIDVLQGTPSANPTAPELSQNTSTYYEVGLADILVEVGASQISQDAITDTRLLNSRCGLATAIGEIDTETLFVQLTTDFNNWFEGIKGQLGDDVAGNLQLQINEHTSKEVISEDGVHGMRFHNDTLEVLENGDFKKAVHEVELYNTDNVSIGRLEKFTLQDSIRRYEYMYRKTSNISLDNATAYRQCAVVNYKNQFHCLGSNESAYNTKHRKWDGSKWVDVSTLPISINGLYQLYTVMDDYIYISNTSGVIYRWSDTTNKWTQVIASGYSISCMFVHDGKLHIAGDKSIYRFNGTAMETVTTTCPYAINYGARCISYKGSIYVLTQVTTDRFYRFNGSTWTNLTFTPNTNTNDFEFRYCGIEIYANELFIAGGSSTNSIACDNNLWAYNGSTWKSKGSLREKSLNICLRVLDDELYVTSGYDYSNSTGIKDFYKYSPDEFLERIDNIYYKNNDTVTPFTRMRLDSIFCGTNNEGYDTSNIFGNNNVGGKNQLVAGHYNNYTLDNSDSGTVGTAFLIGNGTSSARDNAFRVTYSGNIYAKSSSVGTGADYSEYFEWSDGNEENEDRVGYFVTFDDKQKIRKANETDDYVLGIVSGLPCIIGNGDECWKGRYIYDDFGRYIEETFEYEEIVDGKSVTKIGTKFKENPDYNPNQTYIERAKRKEWSAIGMVGVLSVYDDGTCQENGYCTVSDGGIATACEYSNVKAYRVLERVTENIVKVLFK